MKLYAIVSSERASKGQGGNEEIKIEVKGANQENIFELRIIPSNGRYEAKGWYQSNGDRYFAASLNEKGEKQKGECVYHGVINCSRCDTFK